MNSKYLLPSGFKLIGLILLIPCLVLGFWVVFYDFNFKFLTIENFRSIENDLVTSENFTNELAIIGTMFCLFCIAFSRQKIEDEFIFRVRLESLLWATYLNIFLLIGITLTVYSFAFYMVITNMMFGPLLLFIARFNYILYLKPLFLAGKGEHDEK